MDKKIRVRKSLVEFIADDVIKMEKTHEKFPDGSHLLTLYIKSSWLYLMVRAICEPDDTFQWKRGNEILWARMARLYRKRHLRRFGINHSCEALTESGSIMTFWSVMDEEVKKPCESKQSQLSLREL